LSPAQPELITVFPSHLLGGDKCYPFLGHSYPLN
jgi:hypothetical protein